MADIPEDEKVIDYSHVAELVQRDNEEPSPDDWVRFFGKTKEQMFRDHNNNIGNIVQIAVHEALCALVDAFSDQVSSGMQYPLRTEELRDVLDRARNRAPAIADRVMARVAKEEDPYGVRHKEKKS